MPEATIKSRPPVQAVKGIEFRDLPKKLKASGREYDEAWLRRVYEYAKEGHKGQKRRSGEAYMAHPLAVAWLLADLKFDQTCVGVGLLHDLLEDTGTSFETLAAEFGEEIAELVDGVSKIGRHEYVRRDEAQAETFRKLILASANDIRVIVVKLLDRLHNMQTLEFMSDEARARISSETLEIYAPIAHRLGMHRVRVELEDLAFYHLEPEAYAGLYAQLRQKVKLGKDGNRRIERQLADALAEAEIECEISSRVKGYYSIHQKLRRRGIDLSELYDYLAFRVVNGSVKDSYAALGVVHQTWRPIPGRFKDYIAVPKPNLYQSLHTTVIGERGQPFEVQIRTHKMDLIAEEGIAAHWRYKEGKLEPTENDRNIVWLRQLLDWQKEVSDPRAFLNSLKIDLYPDEVYVFTPKGDVMSFPRGATPLDFAYRVHTELGHHCAGSRVNGRLLPLRTALQNGDIVEILTNPNREPSRDWLNIVATPRAKSKIRHWLNVQQKERAAEIGRSMLDRELRKCRQSTKRVLDSKSMKAFLEEESLASPEDLFSRIGFGKMAVRQVLARVLTETQLKRAGEEPGALSKVVRRILPFNESPAVVVRGQDDLLAFLAKCCNPLPGEEIIGYITRGRGVSVHSAECPNVKNLLYHPEREIDVEWARKDQGQYRITLEIAASDQQGLLARLAESIAKLDSNIRHIEAQTGDTGKATIEVAVEVKNRRHLERLVRALAALDGIDDVHRRMTPGQRVV